MDKTRVESTSTWEAKDADNSHLASTEGVPMFPSVLTLMQLETTMSSVHLKWRIASGG
jgi:hypothetical protein